MLKQLNYFLLLLIFTSLSQADEQVISDAGREVLISDDGSWSFISDDRYATNTAGERVKLKIDGSWEVLSIDENLSTAHSAVYRNAPGYESVLITIAEVVIESSRTKASASSKNTHLKSQTVFSVTFTLPESEAQAFTFSPSTSIFSVSDSAGDHYPIIEMTPAFISIEPGDQKEVSIRIDGAPAWKFGKSYELTISADILNANQDLMLSFPLSDTKREEVEAFTTN